MMCGPVAGVEQRVGASVDGDEHGLELADVVAHDPQVSLVARPARNDERMPVPEARAQLRERDPLGEQPPFLPQVAHRVVHERPQSLRHAALLLVQLAFELLLRQPAPDRQTGGIPKDDRSAHGDHVAVADLLEQRRAGGVDERHSAPDELERPRVREAARNGRRDVDDDPHPGLDELLRGDPVELGVVDDRDVIRAEPRHQPLRAPV